MSSSRREFLEQVSMAAVATSTLAPGVALAAPTSSASRPTVLKPPRLRPGDTIGLIDPASATWEPVDIEIVEESWAALGFRTKRGKNLLNRRGYFAGDDEERAADLVSMFADPDVRAVHCVRGGWGSARLLPLIDWKVVAAHPKVQLGYSDITALLLSIHAKAAVVTFHGPVGASKWNPFNVGYVNRVLIDGEAVTFELPSEKNVPLLVAGGIGIASLLALAERLEKKAYVLYEARTKEELFALEIIREHACELFLATDDGSQGEKGTVLNLVERFLDQHHSFSGQCQVYACGPRFMLKALSGLSKARGIGAYASFEENMACGVGACLGCTVKTISGYLRVCKEGPVFRLDDIVW